MHLLMLIVVASSLAAEPAATQTFVLHPACEGFDIQGFCAPSADAPLKPPSDAGEDATKGYITYSWEPDRQIGYILDRDAKTLYLDLNLNSDLSDDPEGVFRADEKGEYPIRFPWGIEGSNAACSAVLKDEGTIFIKSGWRGEGELNGRPLAFNYGIGVSGAIEQSYLKMHLLSAKALPLCVSHRSFYVPFRGQSIFTVGDSAWQFEYAFKGDNVELSALPVSQKLREVRFEGQVDYAGGSNRDLVRRSADGRGALAVALAEDNRVFLPVVQYDSLTLVMEDEQSFYTTIWQSEFGKEQPLTLKFGGPLKEDLGFTQFQAQVRFAYTWSGIGGERWSCDAILPPTLTVSQDGGRLHTALMEPG